MIPALLVTLALAGPRLTVDVYQGGFASVNSFIFSNGQSLVVLDVQRKAGEATKVVELIRAKGLPLTHILISHGHPIILPEWRCSIRPFPTRRSWWRTKPSSGTSKRTRSIWTRAARPG